MKCKQCGGKGSVESKFFAMSCPGCHGSGEEPDDSGASVAMVCEHGRDLFAFCGDCVDSVPTARRVIVRFKRVGALAMPLPVYQSADAVGLDLAAALTESVALPVGARRLIPTGLAVAIPRGFEGQVRPRSGLALKHGITVLNSPGTIDPDYRGEVMVLLANLGSEAFIVEPKTRIAQLVIAPVARAHAELVGELDETARGAGGFGHTGDQ